jgi:hypothetical protein
LADATSPWHDHSTWHVAQYVTSFIGPNNLPSTLFTNNCNLWTKIYIPWYTHDKVILQR